MSFRYGLNCLDATGKHDELLGWMTEQLIQKIEQAAFSLGHPSWNDLRGLYFGEYQRRMYGVDADLYQSDRPRFDRKFGEYMESQVEHDREGYVKRLLLDQVDNRQKLPLIILDNTDEFEMEVKKKIFQYAQALRRHAKHCMVIQPVTDKSAWSFSRTEIFHIYSSKSFFLPTPPPREVFRKRIDYIRKQLASDSTEKDCGSLLYRARDQRIHF